MIQQDFAYRVAELVKKDDAVIGLAAGGSWITNEIDEYSDLDLILITKIKIAGDKEKMMDYIEFLQKTFPLQIQEIILI